MKYKSPVWHLKNKCSLCGRRCVGNTCRKCFRKTYWTEAKRKEMGKTVRARGRGPGRPSLEAERVKEIKKRLGHLA